jgi:hypothetical protein
MESVLLDVAGHRRSPATMPGFTSMVDRRGVSYVNNASSG